MVGMVGGRMEIFCSWCGRKEKMINYASLAMGVVIKHADFVLALEISQWILEQVKFFQKCINCERTVSITGTTCLGSGVLPRYLDRREYKDED
ncbi:unnamed protein product [Calypogeia fissa]